MNSTYNVIGVIQTQMSNLVKALNSLPDKILTSAVKGATITSSKIYSFGDVMSGADDNKLPFTDESMADVALFFNKASANLMDKFLKLADDLEKVPIEKRGEFMYIASTQEMLLSEGATYSMPKYSNTSSSDEKS